MSWKEKLFFLLLLLISIIPLISTTNECENIPDTKNCLNEGMVCFGSRNGIKSYSNTFGCIKYNNCDIGMIAVYNPKDLIVCWHLFAGWNEDMYQNMTAIFAIGKSRNPFESKSGYFEIQFIRNKTSDQFFPHFSRAIYQSSKHADYRRTSCMSKETNEDGSLATNCWECTERSDVIRDNETFVSFGSLTTMYLRKSRDEYLIRTDLINDHVYIHIKLLINGQSRRNLQAISTDKSIKLFDEKIGNNTPSDDISILIDESISDVISDTVIDVSELVTSGTNPTQLSTISSSESVINTTESNEGKKEFSSLFIIIIIVLIVLIALIGISIYFFCSRKQSENNVEKIENRTHHRNKTSSTTSSGNYKKKFDETNYDEEPNQSRKSYQSKKLLIKSKSQLVTEKTFEETAYVPPDDAYSTYFKPK